MNAEQTKHGAGTITLYSSLHFVGSSDEYFASGISLDLGMYSEHCVVYSSAMCHDASDGISLPVRPGSHISSQFPS